MWLSVTLLLERITPAPEAPRLRLVVLPPPRDRRLAPWEAAGTTLRALLLPKDWASSLTLGSPR